MDIHRKSVDMDMDMDVKFHIHGNPDNRRRQLHHKTNKYNKTPETILTKKGR